MTPKRNNMRDFKKFCTPLGNYKLDAPCDFQVLGSRISETHSNEVSMVDLSIKRPVGILFDLLIKIDKFILLVVLVMWDYEINVELPIILGQSFLTKEYSLVVVERKLNFRLRMMS